MRSSGVLFISERRRSTDISLLTERRRELHSHRLRRQIRRVVQNPIAIVAGDHLVAAPHLRHYLWAQGHVTGGTRSVARLRHGDAIANTRADPLVKRAGRLW